MRVTGVVKQYIERRVRAAYQQKVDGLIEQIRIARESEATLKRDMVIELKKDATKLLLANSCIPHLNSDESGFYKNDTYISGWNFTTPFTKIISDSEKEKQLLEHEIREKIDEIVINVELGGTKATLEEEIAKLDI